MDDLYQFMTPIGDTTTPAPSKPPTTTDDTTTTTTTTSPSQDSPSSSTSPSTARSSWSTWGASAAWGASLNKFIERGKKDMNEFVDVTRKDLNELVQTVQAESSTTVASLSKKVEDLKKSTTLPASVSAVVEGIKQEITEAATGLSSHVQQPQEEQHKEGEQGEKDGEARKSTSQDATADNAGEDKTSMPEGEAVVVEASTSSNTTTSTATAPRTRAEKTTSGLSFASTASLLTAGANTLTQTLSSSTKDIGTSANQLFKKTLPAVAEKHLGEADQFLKSTTETLKSNGLIAEQYVNKLGSGVANFINSAVVISAPEEKEHTRSKKMFFDRKAAMLEELRLDPATYTVDPMTTIADNDIVGLERYKYFLQTFNMAEYQQRISRLLNEYPEVKALMHKLVPMEVADEELFWLRYHFRLFEIEEEEKRRKKLVQEVGNDAEDEFTWDDDEEEESDTKHHSQQQHGSTTPKASSTTPKASTSTTLTPEALASSLSALPVPSSSSDKIRNDSGSEDEWGAESPKAALAPVGANLAVTAAKSPTNMSSTRTSEDSYAVVDGVETPIRGGGSGGSGGAAVNSVQSVSSEASSPRVEQPAQQASKKDAKEEDDWSDWE
ncbi:hypothetical protein BGZ92_000171 [Podila epicladia]|nr:hypothetical protein BGZ92_000171 [Podila epicladia]